VSDDEMGFGLFGDDDMGPGIVHRKVFGSPPKPPEDDKVLNVHMYVCVCTCVVHKQIKSCLYGSYSNLKFQILCLFVYFL